MNTILLCLALTLFVSIGGFLVSRLRRRVSWRHVLSGALNGMLGGTLGGGLIGILIGVLSGGMSGMLSGGMQGMLGGMLSGTMSGGLIGVLIGGMVGVLIVGLMGGLSERPRAHLVRRGNVARMDIAEAIVAQKDQRPPAFAEYLLHFLPKTMREALPGDLEEEYHQMYARFGKRRATFWYYVQVALSFWPLLSMGVKQLIIRGLLGWVGDVVRRLIP